MAKHPIFTLQKRLGRLGFLNRGQFDAWVDGLDEGKWVRAEFKLKNPNKTLPQLGYWYSVVIPNVLDGLVDAGYDSLFVSEVRGFDVAVEITAEDVDKLLKVLYRTHAGLEAVPAKRRMTKEDMSNMIDFTLKWAAEYLGIVIPEPRKEE